MEDSDRKQVEALVSLLGDEDPKIHAMVVEHLVGLGAAALPILKKSTEDPDPRLRLRVRHLMQRIVLDEIETRLEEMGQLSDEEFDLEAGCHLLARLENPEVQRDTIAKGLDDIADRIRPRLQGLARPLDQVRIVNQVLFDEMHFSGNSRDYYDAENAFLHRVLERRTGIPVTLATVYLLVAWRLGLPIFGVSLPSNFLVRYSQANGEDIFVDPFLNGKLLGRRDCVQYLATAGYYRHDAYIADATSRDMIVRMLRHLVVVYSKQQDGNRTSRLNRFAELLQSRARTR